MSIGYCLLEIFAYSWNILNDLLYWDASPISYSQLTAVGKGRKAMNITKQEKTMKKRNRKGTLRVDTAQWNEYIEM